MVISEALFHSLQFIIYKCLFCLRITVVRLPCYFSEAYPSFSDTSFHVSPKCFISFLYAFIHSSSYHSAFYFSCPQFGLLRLVLLTLMLPNVLLRPGYLCLSVLELFLSSISACCCLSFSSSSCFCFSLIFKIVHLFFICNNRLSDPQQATRRFFTSIYICHDYFVYLVYQSIILISIQQKIYQRDVMHRLYETSR